MEYIDINELCTRLKLKRQTIYNLIYKNKLNENTHYFKPTKKILRFDWEAIEAWLRGGVPTHKEMRDINPEITETGPNANNLINI